MSIFDYTQYQWGCRWGQGQGMMDGYGGSYGMGGYGVGYGGIGMIVLGVLLIAGIVLFIRKFAPSSQSKSRGEVDTPLDMLQKRYANGEINKEEFEDKKKDLS